ncbi:DNA polymerase V subunit UmuC, partial [Vibrio parahaemolyticus]|nr:DNA polymerase V subunit UmuC [Vibrio parahaemolyticus]
VGIGPTKTLAKVANRRAKKDPARGGVCLLDTEAAQTEALAALDLADVWGVGRRLVARLAGLGITTPLQGQKAPPRKNAR